MNKLAAMRTFRRVIELGSFTAAASDLRLSKSAVSKHVALLERDLQRPLLTRTSRRLRPTPAGERYVAVCARVLDELSKVEAEFGPPEPLLA